MIIIVRITNLAAMLTDEYVNDNMRNEFRVNYITMRDYLLGMDAAKKFEEEVKGLMWAEEDGDWIHLFVEMCHMLDGYKKSQKIGDYLFVNMEATHVHKSLGADYYARFDWVWDSEFELEIPKLEIIEMDEIYGNMKYIRIREIIEKIKEYREGVIDSGTVKTEKLNKK